MKDYYKILEISRDASQDEIKKSYRKLSKEYHPDRNPNDEESEKKFKEINEAYSILSDENKKNEYDHKLKMEDNQFAGFNANFYNFMDSMFEEFMSPKYDPSLLKIQCSLKEIFKKSKKTIEYVRMGKCEECNGSGRKDDVFLKCPDCDGKGHIKFGNKQFIVKKCSKCEGQGKIPKNICEKCNGQGALKENNKINISIPRNISNKSNVKFENCGNYIKEAELYTDLIIEFNIKDDFYSIEDNMMFCKIPLTFNQLVLGDTIKIPHPVKKIKLNIPPKTSSGTSFRIKKWGLNKNGDCFATVYLDVPEIKDENEDITEDNLHYEKVEEFNNKVKNNNNY